MCLAIPAQIKSIEPSLMGEVDILGVTRSVALDLVPKAVSVPCAPTKYIQQNM